MEIRHGRIEKLFEQGLVTTSLFIEAHRQIQEFTQARNEQETQTMLFGKSMQLMEKFLRRTYGIPIFEIQALFRCHVDGIIFNIQRLCRGGSS